MLNAIIVDDEKNSRDSLHRKLDQYCEDVEVLRLCENGEQAIQAITELRPALVFLDVEMPRMNGFTMLQQLQQRDFELIFTTAYDHYAIEAIRYSALDYLVKPIDPADLVNAVERAGVKLATDRARGIPDDRGGPAANDRLENLLKNLQTEHQYNRRIAIPSMEGLEFIEQEQILYLEARSNYTEIFLADLSKITVSRTLKDFEEMLPSSIFLRAHHSHLINKHHVLKYIKGEGGQVMMRDKRLLDVARRKKDEFLKALGQ